MIANKDEIKAKADIIDIISHFIPLKRSGANYQTQCPFHNEKSASFIVSPAKQIYTCFGCGKSGDSFSFVKDYKNVDFSEAVEIVAELSGVQTIKTKQKQDKFKDISEKFNSLFDLALKELHNQPKIKQYLINRGLSDDDFKTFSIGYMPELSKVNSIFSQQEALEIGLLKKRQSGNIYTPFANRIIFAIRNKAYKIIALAGRTHPYSDFVRAPKYINSSDSFIYKKSQTPYLLSHAKSHIIKQKEVILCEGYMDAIALHKLGFKHAIATSGTALNLSFLNEIIKICNDVYFNLCFDKDKAGVNAQLRAIELLFNNGFYHGAVLELKGDYKDISEALEHSVSTPPFADLENLRGISQTSSLAHPLNSLKATEERGQSLEYYKQEENKPAQGENQDKLVCHSEEARRATEESLLATSDLNKQLFKSYTLLEYYFYTKFKQSQTPKDKEQLLKYLKELYKNEPSYYEKEFLLEKLSTLTKIPKEYFTQERVQNSSNSRLYNLLYAIYNNQDFTFLAKESLDLESIPQAFRVDLQTFLETKSLTPDAMKIALNETYKKDYTQISFYNELLCFNIQHAKTKLNQAKATKDLKQIIALNHYIQKLDREIRVSYLF